MEQIPRRQLIKRQMNPLYGVVAYMRGETGCPVLPEPSNGKCSLTHLLQFVKPLSMPPTDGQKASNDSIELNCRRYLSAVRVLLPQEGGAVNLSKALPGTIKNALSMFVPDPFSPGAFRYDEKYYYQMYVKALPMIAATFKDLIDLLLRQGADPGETAGLDYPRRWVLIQTAAEALIFNFWRNDFTREFNLGEKVDRTISDTILETLQLILRAGHSYVSPHSMHMLLARSLSLNLPFLHVYLDSIPLLYQRLYIDQFLELLETAIRRYSQYCTTSTLMLLNTDQNLKDTLTHHKSMLLSLRYLCRHCIISVLRKLDTDTDRLPLPAALKHYIRHVAKYQ